LLQNETRQQIDIRLYGHNESVGLG